VATVPDDHRSTPSSARRPEPEQAAGGLDAGEAYPAHWEADVVLRDGGTAHLRPIRPDDAEALQRFHVSQSPESIYLRFFAPMPRLSDRDLLRFTHVDHHDRVAFVITIGSEIIGVGRFDRVEPTSAEVAFNISDAHQGRGIGSVLLEHLAAAARERGVRRFVAEVLPQNRKMMSVFRDAGYEVRHQFEDGVISLGFDLDPTEKSLAVMASREHRAEARSVHALLNPASVVLVGASRREGTIGHELLAQLLRSGFSGSLNVVHPEADQVLGLPTFRRLADVPRPVDLAVVAVPAAAVLDVVRDCARAGVRGLVVVSGGFAETGAQGRERQGELVRVARANGMRVVGPNSWGMLNTDPGVRLNVTLISSVPPPGRLGLFCQSGALSLAVLGTAARRGIGVSTFLSAGNRADVSGNDCLQYWEADPNTDVVGLYLESTGNPRKFSRIARRLSRNKPVVVVTSGTSGFGVPPGHPVRATGAPRAAFDAMLAQTGCLRVDSVHELFDVGQLLLDQPLPAGDAVAVVANSVALGSLVADTCLSRGLSVVHPPVAVAVLAEPDEIADAVAQACADPAVDAVVVAIAPPMAGRIRETARALDRVAATVGQPVVACLLGADVPVPDSVPDTGRSDSGPGSGSEKEPEPRRVPSYPTPEEAVGALATVCRYAAWRRRDPGERVDPIDRDPLAAKAFVDRLLGNRSAQPAEPGERPAAAAIGIQRSGGADGMELTPDDAARLLAYYGIVLWPALPVHGAAEAAQDAARLGWPVAVKTTAPHLRHRVDLGGVRLDVADAETLTRAVTQMRQRLGPLGGSNLVVQRMAPAGVACVVRTMEDPQFGPVVSFGVGGDASELLGDVAYRIAPLTDVEVRDMVRAVRAAPKLFGHRGATPLDVTALEDLIGRLACLADELPEVASIELNPVVVAETGAAVLGATIRLAPAGMRPDAERRELEPGW